MEIQKGIFEQALYRIEQATIQPDPFPHIIIEKLFPDHYYRSLLDNFPARAHFQEVTYPGTGFGQGAFHYHDYGLSCLDFSEHPFFCDLSAFFQSEQFSRVLLDKFSQQLPNGFTPIPAQKHRFFKDGATDFTSVRDLQIDLPGYEAAPHPDIEQKIVTYQFFLVEDDSLRDYGTHLCKPKNGKTTARRSKLADVTGWLLMRVARMLRVHHSGAYRRLERSAVGLQLGVGDTHNWMPWELFDVVKVAPALPNHFLAFAPNDRSYHAVRLNIPLDYPRQERPVIRGFIRSGRNTRNWISPKACR